MRRILDAAGELFDRWSYQDISIQRIADATGLAKGTVYLYFATKEQLFLSLFDSQAEEWFGALQYHLDEHDGPTTAAETGTMITATLCARPTLIRLFALRHRCLDGDIRPEAATAHLREHDRRTNNLAISLTNHADISIDQAKRWIQRTDAIISGLAQQARPDTTNGGNHRLDFESELRHIATILLEQEMKRAEA